MKYSFMSFSTPSMTWVETLRYARTVGYGGVEPRVECQHAHGIELERTKGERLLLARQASDAGIEICCVATGLTFCSPDNVSALLESARKYIELAADLNCPLLRVFGGPLPQEMDRESAIDLMAEHLRDVADDLESVKVTLCVETHDEWTDPSHVAEVMRRANHARIAVNWDVMHPTRVSGVPIPDTYGILKPWIRHSHVHDSSSTSTQPFAIVALGTGELDIESYFRLLLDNSYDGYISGEWIGCADTCDPAQELAFMKGLESRLSIVPA
ncbi:MAG TPA: sugar phosphate isomerase/epimerase family protein [Capsulimonadaceae bacterium]|jgi:sugar phosphate isomerase/epimerase